MPRKLTRKPLLTLAAVALVSGSLVLAQQPAPAPSTTSTPSTAPAPVERRTPPRPYMRPGMRQGMQPSHRGPANFRSGMTSHGSFRAGSGGHFHGAPMMGAGFHIAPGGMWWKSPSVVERLALTPDQVKRMDGIFEQSRLQLIDLKANLEKQEVMLEPMLSANPPDTTKAMTQIDKVADARADLEKADAKMLLGLRGVLTPDQWTKLHTRPTRNGAPPAPGAPPAAENGPQGPRGYGGGYVGRGRSNAGEQAGPEMDDTRP